MGWAQDPCHGRHPTACVTPTCPSGGHTVSEQLVGDSHVPCPLREAGARRKGEPVLETRAVSSLRTPCRCKALQTGRWYGDIACTPSLSQSLSGGPGHSDLLGCSSQQTERHFVFMSNKSLPTPPAPAPFLFPKLLLPPKRGANPSPGTHNQDQGATDKSWLYSRSRGQLCHWQLPSYCTSSDGGISMPRHNTASALWDLGEGAGTVTSQQAGEQAGAPRVHKGKRPVHP